jgi:hypothetical protein
MTGFSGRKSEEIKLRERLEVSDCFYSEIMNSKHYLQITSKFEYEFKYF